MKRITVTDWAWNNCILKEDKAPKGLFNSCFFDNAYAVDDETLEVYKTMTGEVIAETEKAVCVKVRIMKFNHRCDIYGGYDWKFWIPKSQIKTDNILYFDSYKAVEMFIADRRAM